MKNLYTLLAFILFTGLTAFGQGKVDYDSRSRFYLGFNFGATYHSNTEVDVNRLYRGGAGFTFGYSFGMKPGKLLSLDLQARYLLAAYRGLSSSKYTLNSNTDDLLNNGAALSQPYKDYQAVHGYYVPNFHSWVNDWSLELKLNTNRLRENTGWNFFVLGGIGTVRYNTDIDLYDNNNALNGQVKPEADLFEKGVLIRDYETSIVDKRDWMPSFGAGIERQITPNASFHIMGRMTWTRNNDFDGLANTFSGQSSTANDRYHYASAGVKFYLRGRANAHVEDDEDPIVNPTPTPPVQGQKPVARFTTPKNTPITVSTASYTLFALVQNVVGKQNITFTQNGQTISNFGYNANTDKLNYSANLIQGQNTFTVKGVNNYGVAEDQTVIIYKPANTLNPPIVTITNPNTSTVTVNNNTFPFTATVLNVNSKQNISVNFNGNNYSNFNFNTNTKQLSTTLNLVSGKNVVTVTGTNTVGSDSKTTEIIYRKTTTGPPPVVTFIAPSTNPFQTSTSTTNVTASVTNVSGKNDVTVKVNGGITNNFTFSSGQVSLNTVLVQGNNVIEVKGTNQFGQDVATTTIVYNQTQAVQPPVVTISTPTNGANYSVPVANVQGKALYVNSKGDVSVYINGLLTSNFSFNSNSKLVIIAANLINGNNTIKIVGVNTDGQDQAIVNVVYNKPVVLAPPVVTIIDPAIDNKTYTVSAITAKATVLNVSGKNNISVQVNGNGTNNFTYNSSNKIVTIPLSLNTGSNKIVVTGTNNDGSDSKQRIIMYKKAVTVNPPTVQFTNPSVTPVTVKTPVYTISAVTTNISSKSQIVLKQNGVVVSSNAYSYAGTTISYPTTLVLGNNIFNVVVSNTAGTDSKSTLINYEKEVTPCTKPTIGYVAPAPNSIVSAAAQNIEAQINNYKIGTTVKLKLNGANLGAMSYNSSTQIANKSVTLNSGVNTLEVTVENDCGTNKSTFILNYKPTTPCLAPIVKITSSSSTVTSNNYSLLGSIANVTGSQQVTVTLNGASKAFSLVNGKLSANLVLQSGNNIIIITATNTCGTDSKTVSIVSNPCQAPKLILVKPLGTSVTTIKSQYDLSLKVTGTVTQSDITVKLNSKSIPFSFNSISKVITINVSNLTNGVNTLQVLVKNSCGNDVVNYRITANICVSPKVTLPPSFSGRVTTVSSLNYSFVGTVSGMTSKNGINLKLNNKAVGFSFNASTGKVTASLLLKEGANAITLSAANACGTDTKILTVQAKTCSVPKLTAVSPGTTVSTDKSSQTFVLNATGIASSSEITVRLNGVAISKSYSNGKLTASTTNLKVGINTLVVNAKNNCGSDKVTYTVTRKVCSKPAVTLLSTNSKVTSLTYSYSAKVSAVTAKQGVVLKLNNKTVSFNFNVKTGLVTSALTLVEGKNTIILTASNNCGAGSKSHVVTATTCKQPEIKVAYPTNTNITTANNTFTILAIGINVSQSDIKVTNDGVAIPFTFNSSTGKITVAVTNMKQGVNNIKIKGTNPCGSSEVNYVLTYTGSSNSGTGDGGKVPQKRN